MNVLFGSPGRLSGLVLRMGQCSFAASSFGIMLSASGFSASTAFWASLGSFKFGKCHWKKKNLSVNEREREMNELFGSPGRMSGFALRIGQCLFAAASIVMMILAPDVPIKHILWFVISRMLSYFEMIAVNLLNGYFLPEVFKAYLIASMGLQILWSFSLACVDMQALRLRRNLRHPVLLTVFMVGDWVTSLLSLGAASASAGVVLLYARDLNYCSSNAHPPCTKFQISVALAFISWFLLAMSSFVMFWLLCAV